MPVLFVSGVVGDDWFVDVWFVTVLLFLTSWFSIWFRTGGLLQYWLIQHDGNDGGMKDVGCNRLVGVGGNHCGSAYAMDITSDKAVVSFFML